MSGSDWGSSTTTTWPCGRRRAGFELAVAHDLFVHHFGSRTFAGNGIDAESLLEENARRFAEKWGHDAPRGRRVALEARGRALDDGTFRPRDVQRDGSPARSHEVDRGRRPSDAGRRDGDGSALTMIVRDEETNLPRCLASVRGVFDEIVVVDTGSVDRTREVAREYGAKVFEFAWIDDFAAARNAALEHATGDYAFWLDADDVIEPGQRETLAGVCSIGLRAWRRGRPTWCDAPATPAPTAAAARPSSITSGCSRSGPTSAGPTASTSRSCRPCDGPASPCAGPTWSSGTPGMSTSPCGPGSSSATARILLEELKDRPDEPFILFNLGAIAIERKDWPGALEYLGKSLAHSAPSDSITRKLFALIARAHQMLGDSEAALRVCAEGLAIDPEDAELLFRKAVIHRHRGEPAEAEALLADDPEAHASRAVRQRGHGDLRASHPAQPGGAGRRAGRSRGRGAALAGRARRMPRRWRGPAQAGAARAGGVRRLT